MNRQSPDIHGKEAVLNYSATYFSFKKKGDFVRCATTGAPIPIDELKYWSVERQEAYVDAAASLQRMQKKD